ncbi:MAG: transcriptional regulator, TetR family [Frankiales bacterium]|jgi:AcrR family transcriptional regulator|nr:transcriptional regulator, TetR family [Frankiales bacterium]
MKLRADAARNRAALVEAASSVFAEQGLDASLDEIARLAGTGNATLYRRFPTRSDLVAAVFADRMAEHVSAVEAGLADDDPWRGFRSYVEAVTGMQAQDRGLADLVTMDISSAPEIEALRRRAYEGLVRLVERARRAGVLRADFTDQDVVLLLMANAGLVERTPHIAVGASARLIGLLLDGLRAEAARDAPAPPPQGDVREAMRRRGGSLERPDPMTSCPLEEHRR